MSAFQHTVARKKLEGGCTIDSHERLRWSARAFLLRDWKRTRSYESIEGSGYFTIMFDIQYWLQLLSIQ